MSSSLENRKQLILDAFHFRHACKEFDPHKKISEEDFRFILETARLSPSSLGLEPWKFVVVQDAVLREKLRAVSWGAQGQLPTASHFVILLARTREGILAEPSYLAHVIREVKQVPEETAQEMINRYTNFINSFASQDERLIFAWTCRQTYIALGNMMTAAALIGIDSCPIEGFDYDKVTDILQQEGILTDDRFGVSCMAAFGYRAKDPSRPKTRQPLEAIVEWR